MNLGRLTIQVIKISLKEQPLVIESLKECLNILCRRNES